MISISANLNIMIKAAEKASKSVIRDFGEVEKLQVSKKGPYDFVTKTDKQVEKIYQYIVFNCLIGNGDAHLKNFALQYPADHSRVFVSPIFDVTHTLIYPTINNKMALKMGTDKAFPDHAALLKLASTEGIKIRNAATIIEHLADGIAEYLAQSNEVNLVSGLKESILANLRNCAVKHPIKPVFRHSKKRKFDNN